MFRIQERIIVTYFGVLPSLIILNFSTDIKHYYSMLDCEDCLLSLRLRDDTEQVGPTQYIICETKCSSIYSII